MAHESKPKSELTLLLRHELLRYVIFRHEDKATYGIPDTSITGNGATAWLEIKLADPDFQSHGQQELNMRRLANVGFYARYIIYENIERVKRVRIVHPRDFVNWRTSGDVMIGWDHQWVVEEIRKALQNDLVRS